jgi:ferritin
MAKRRLSEERDLPLELMGRPRSETSPGPGDEDAIPGLEPDLDSLGTSPDPQAAPGEPHVIGRRLRRLLTRQVRMELDGQQAYMGISLYFERRNLVRWARLFRDRADEESRHAARIMRFLAASGLLFDVPKVAAAPTRFKSPTRAIRTALGRPRRLTARVNVLAREAASKGDGESLLLVHWLIERQVAEEREMRRLADLVASGVNLFQAELLLDHGPQHPPAGRAADAGGPVASSAIPSTPAAATPAAS